MQHKGEKKGLTPRDIPFIKKQFIHQFINSWIQKNQQPAEHVWNFSLIDDLTDFCLKICESTLTNYACSNCGCNLKKGFQFHFIWAWFSGVSITKKKRKKKKMRVRWFNWDLLVLKLLFWWFMLNGPVQFTVKYCHKYIKKITHSLSRKRRPVMSDLLDLWSQSGTSSHSALCSAFIMGPSLTVLHSSPRFYANRISNVSRWALRHVYYRCWTSHAADKTKHPP